jgi:hypothetical protein
MWIFLVSGPVLTEGTDAFAAFQAGQYSFVEGTVTEFHPMPYEGHDDEMLYRKGPAFLLLRLRSNAGFS